MNFYQWTELRKATVRKENLAKELLLFPFALMCVISCSSAVIRDLDSFEAVHAPLVQLKEEARRLAARESQPEAPEASQLVVQETPQLPVPEASQPVVQETPQLPVPDTSQSVVQETPQLPVPDAAQSVENDTSQVSMPMDERQREDTASTTNVKTGSAAYYIPKEMVVSESVDVNLWIDINDNLENLKIEFAEKLDLDAKIFTAHKIESKNEAYVSNRFTEIVATQLTVSNKMYAELVGGKEFEISPKGKIKQSLTNTGRAKWFWKVTPLSAENEEATLTITIWIDPSDTETLTETYHGEVLVSPKPKPLIDKIIENAQKLDTLLTLLGIGGIGVMFGHLRNKMFGGNRPREPNQ